MRPKWLDRIGVDDRLLAFVFALLLWVWAAGCEIPIPPGPTPDPINPPVPVVTTEATIIVIEETANRDFDTASILGDIAFWTSLGVKFRLYDDDSPDAAKYLNLVKERPGMIVLDKAGKKTWAGALPKTTDEVRRLVK